MKPATNRRRVLPGALAALTAAAWTAAPVAPAQEGPGLPAFDPPPVSGRLPALIVPAPPADAARPPPGAAAADAETANPRLRDPFWPVGYAPPAGGEDARSGAPVAREPARAGEVEWRAAQKLLALRGVSRIRGAGGDAICAALINGRLVQAGETVSVILNGKTFRWRVTEITMEKGPVYERIVPAPGAK
jgi:hypothetical protein